jgi:hypothetical protein
MNKYDEVEDNSVSYIKTCQKCDIPLEADELYMEEVVKDKIFGGQSELCTVCLGLLREFISNIKTGESDEIRKKQSEKLRFLMGFKPRSWN